ncbi:MAG: protein-glutamate O-methyltransferase family protein [Oscillochloris sp.]|nr:protein-glutamate O-methyltransferase family protein [Oscillochloris sp.]
MTDTPFTAPPPLRGAEIGSFAHDTVARRMPATVRRIPVENSLTPGIAYAVLALADEIPNAPIRLLRDPNAPDVALWDAYTTPYLGQSWLEAPWFFSEIYMYRRILEATGYFQPGPGHRTDPYALQKRLGLEYAEIGPTRPNALGPIAAAISAALWGNQADLSLWPVGESAGPGGAHLLADDTEAAVTLIETLATRQARVDIILDNAGVELIHDLALANVLLSDGLHVILHAKPHPTFVSDALITDVQTTIAWLADQPGPIANIGVQLSAALNTGQLELRDDWYWTSPLVGWHMPAELHADLGTSELLISKGDANYRRWLGDRHWPFDTPLGMALRYLPVPMLLLRTCKSDVAAGLIPTRIADAEARDPEWVTGGRWGVIQLYQP